MSYLISSSGINLSFFQDSWVTYCKVLIIFIFLSSYIKNLLLKLVIILIIILNISVWPFFLAFNDFILVFIWVNIILIFLLFVHHFIFILVVLVIGSFDLIFVIIYIVTRKNVSSSSFIRCLSDKILLILHHNLLNFFVYQLILLCIFAHCTR